MNTTTRTIAEQIAAALNDDGTVFTSDEGDTLDDLAAMNGGTREGSGTPGRYRWIFEDDSVLVIAGAGWDFEGEETFSWRG